VAAAFSLELLVLVLVPWEWEWGIEEGQGQGQKCKKGKNGKKGEMKSQKWVVVILEVLLALKLSQIPDYSFSEF
jgi:hypothetical protein